MVTKNGGFEIFFDDEIDCDDDGDNYNDDNDANDGDDDTDSNDDNYSYSVIDDNYDIDAHECSFYSSGYVIK